MPLPKHETKNVKLSMKFETEASRGPKRQMINSTKNH